MLHISDEWEWESKSINSIISDQFAAITKYGLFVNDHIRARERSIVFEKEIPKRVAFLVQLLEVLESKLDITIIEAIPFCYSTQEWDTRKGLTGYCSKSGPKASNVLMSYYQTHYLYWHGGDRSNFSKVYKCILNMHLQFGVDSAIKYALDCLKSGLFINENIVKRALLYYFWSIDKHKDEVVQAVLGEKAEWSKKLVEISEEFHEYNLNPKDARLKTLLSYSLRELEISREVKSYDDWIIQQYFLSKLTEVVLGLFSSIKTDLKTKIILSRLEEIRADTGSVTSLSYTNPFSNSALITAQVLVRMFESKVGNETWVERLFIERAIIPTAFKEDLLKADFSLSKTKEWEGLSHKYIGLFIIGFCGLSSDLCYLFDNDTKWEDTNFSIQLELLEKEMKKSYGIININERALYLKGLTNKWKYNWMAWWELSICLDKLNETEEAKKAVINAIHVCPQNAYLWKSFSIILGNLNCFQEAIFASTVSEFLKDTEKEPEM